MIELVGAVHTPLNSIDTLKPIYKTSVFFEKSSNYKVVKKYSELDEIENDIGIVRFNTITITSNLNNKIVFCIHNVFKDIMREAQVTKKMKEAITSLIQNDQNFEHLFFLIDKDDLQFIASSILDKLYKRFSHTIYINLNFNKSNLPSIMYSDMKVKNLNYIKFVGDAMIIAGRMCDSLFEVVPKYTILYLLSGEVENLGIWINFINKQYNLNIDKEFCWEKAWGDLHSLFHRYVKEKVEILQLYPVPKPIEEIQLSYAELDKCEKIYSKELKRKHQPLEPSIGSYENLNLSKFVFAERVK